MADRPNPLRPLLVQQSFVCLEWKHFKNIQLLGTNNYNKCMLLTKITIDLDHTSKYYFNFK